MGKRLVILMVLMQLTFLGWSQSKNYRLRQWSSKDGLPQNSIPSLIQDHLGFIWITTLEGLVRFDGFELKLYSSKTRPDIFYNRMLQVVEDKSGHIWISTEEGGLYHFDRNSFTYYTREELGITGYITAMVVLSDGSILMGTTGGGFLFGTEGEGLLKFRNGKSDFVQLSEFSSKRISKIFISSDNMIWVASGEGLYRMDENFKKVSKVAEGWILDIDEYDANELVFSTGKELTKINVNTLSTSVMLKSSEEINNFSQVTVDKNKAIWLATDTEDFYRIEGNSIVDIEADQNMNIPIMWSSMCDLEGNIWIGSNGSGLMQLSEVPVRNIQVKDGLPNNIVWSVSNGLEGEKYVSTYNGFARVDGDGAVHEYPIHIPQMNRLFWSSFVDSKGKLWIGSGTEGLLTLKNGRVVKERQPYPSLQNGVKAFYESDDGTLWIGTSNGVFAHNGGQFSEISFGEQKNKNVKVLKNIGDSLLVGTGRGLYTISDSIARPFLHDKITAGVRDVWIDNNLIWIATEGYGLFIHNLDGKTFSFSTKDGMFDNFISHLYPAPDGSIWFTTNTGIFSVPKKTFISKMQTWNSVEIAYRVFNEIDGMAVAEVNGGVYPSIFSDGNELWVPTMSGIAVFDHRAKSVTMETFPILFTQVEVNNEKVVVENGNSVHIKAGRTPLSLSFSGLNFRNPERLVFEYCLGEHHEWVPIGKSRQLRFENIESGKYEIRVRSPLPNGSFAVSEALFIVKAPEFYQTYWFWILVLILSSGLAYAAVQRRIRNLVSRERDLQKLVFERTQDLNNAKELIENSNRQLSARNDQLRDLVHIKNDFVSMATHDLKTPLQSILGFSDILEEESDEDSLVTALTKKIRGSSLKMLDIIDNILSKVREDNQSIEIKRYRSNLTRLVYAVVDENSLAAISKGQQLKVDIKEQVIANVDEFWMGRAIENLVGNAIKYSPPKSDILISLKREGSNIVFAVDDAGQGIPDEDKSNVFGMYYKSGNKPTAGEFSTGIGLAIVKQVVDNHEGEIHVLDSERGGCRFEVILPQ